MRLGLLLIPLLATPSFAAESWTLPPFTPDASQVYEAAQKFTSPSNADVYFIEARVTLAIDQAGRLTNKRYVLARIVTDLGAKQFPKIMEPWLTWRQQRPVLLARVITANKQAHALDPKTITETSLPTENEVYDDVKILQAPLPTVGAGSLVEYQIEVADRKTVMPGARFYSYSASWPFPAHHLTVQVDASSPLRTAARGFETIERKDLGPESVRYEAWDMRKHEAKPMLPPEITAGPEIFAATAPSWQSVARWYWDLTEPLLGKADGHLVSEADREATVRSILADIQKNVRYTGLELGMNAYQPHTPAETLTRGYGDCKDKATLLISRLRAAGIRAQYALLKPFPFSEIAEDMPGVEAFNHVIVFLPGAKPTWIDPTSQFTPGSRLPITDQGRRALIVDPETTGLTRTPENPAGQDRLQTETTVLLQPQGKAKFTAKQVFTGAAEEFIRNAFSLVLSSPAQKTQVETTLNQRFRSERITSLESDSPLQLDKPFEVRWAGEGLPSGNTTGDSAVAAIPLDLDVFGGLTQLAIAEKPDNKEKATKSADEKLPRKEDYFLLNALTAEIRTVIVPPPGFRVKQVPEVHDIGLAGATLERVASLRPDNAVVITDRYTVPSRRFTVAEAEKIAAELKDAAKQSAVRVEFVDQVRQLLTSGKDKDAISSARERVLASPKDSAALIRLAAALSAAGANADGIDACLRATTLEPGSVEAYTQLADLYSRDDAGRAFRPGMQRTKAIEAQKTAIQLKPDDAVLAAKLSRLYQFNEKGVFLGTRSNPGEAVKVLRKVETHLEESHSESELASALVYNRQYSDVKALFVKSRNAFSISSRLAAIAATENIESAIAAFDSSGTSEPRAKAFTDAAQMLVRVREYAGAASLLREASKDGDSAAQSDAELLAQTLRRADAKYSEKAPTALTQRLIYALLDSNDDQQWKQLLVPEWRDDLKLREERNQIWRSLAAYHQVAKMTTNWDTTADLAVSNGVFFSDGSDASGYRVRMADPSNNGVMKTVAWVVKRGNEYQVLGSGSDSATLGGEALAAAKRQDSKAAKLWLDWMREDAPHPTATDPLSGIAFTRLWTPESSGLNKATLAAASLAARGAHYEEALNLLRNAAKQAAPGPTRDALDLAIVQSLFIHWKFADAFDEAKGLQSRFPDSEIALRDMALAMNAAGQDAEGFLDTLLAKDRSFAAALRAQSRVREAKGNFSGGVDSLRKLSQTSKATPADWNSLAWASLFTDDIGEPALKAATTANRLTQNHNASFQHTLGCVRAATGDTAGARQALFLYLDLVREIDDGARLLLGMIQEQLGLTNSARQNYSKIEKPRVDSTQSSYALAQKRVKEMKTSDVTHLPAK